jgi:hypothetical protein
MSVPISAPRFRHAALAAAVMAAATSMAQAAPLSVNVSAVGFTPSPLVRPDPASVGVSATVNAGFAPASTTSTSVPGNCVKNSFFDWKQLVTATVVEVKPGVLNVTANDGINVAPMGGPNGGTFSGTLTHGAEGKSDVKVTANGSQVTTTTVIKVTTLYADGACSTPTGASTETSSDDSIASGSGFATGSYLIDLVPGTLAVFPNTGLDATNSVIQGGEVGIHTKINDGSAGTPYTVINTVTAPDLVTTFQGSASDNFGTSPHGISLPKNNIVAIKISCDAPLGVYSVAAVAKTVDLAGNAYDDLATAGNTFNVTPGSLLSSQTMVLSQLANGDYGGDQCFTSSANSRGKLTNAPGSVHIASQITTTGPCAGFSTFTPSQAVLTLPTGFAFADTGKSPPAHVFMGTGAPGDLHNPNTPGWTEVTALVRQSVSGLVNTIELSGLGSLPSTTGLYIRAHAVYTGPGAVPPDSLFVFTTSASATTGGGTPLSNTSTQSIVGNPSAQVCIDGNYPQATTAAALRASRTLKRQ